MGKLSSASESLHYWALPSTERTSFSCPQAPAIVRFPRLKCPSYCLRIHGYPDDYERNGVLSQRKDHLLHALPLPTVTTDSDADGSAPTSPTSEHGGKLWEDRTKNRDVLITFQQGLETLHKVLKETKRNRWTVYGINLWEKMAPWIKLPIAIFFPWCLFITAFYGPSVSMDLLPLWIIGPSVAGLLVKMSVKMSAACRQWLADKSLKGTALHVLEGIQTGEWLKAVGARLTEARLRMMERTSKWVSFIRSGRLIVVIKQYMHRKLVEWWDSWVDRFQDWRLVYLRWERTLKNIV